MSIHTRTCAQCGERFDAASDAAITCSVSCRNRRYRANLMAQRARLAAQAEHAIASGDVAALEQVARSTVALLAA